MSTKGKPKTLVLEKISCKWIISTLFPIFAIIGVVIGVFTFFVFPTNTVTGLGVVEKSVAWVIFIVLYALMMTTWFWLLALIYNVLAPKLGPITIGVRELGGQDYE